MKMMNNRTRGFAAIFFLISGITTQAATVTDNFNTPQNYLTNGVIGTIWDGRILPGDIPGGNPGAGLGSVTNINSSITSNGVFTVSSANTDWENAADDGFFLYKIVTGDFDMSVQLLPPIDNGAFHIPGLMVRAFGPGGSPFQPTNSALTENYLHLGRFDEFNIANVLNNNINGNDNEINLDAFGNNNYWMRIERVGDTFNTYEKAAAADPWNLVNTLDRPDFAGAPLQVGIQQATFNSGGAFRTAYFDDFSLSGPNVIAGGSDPAPATGLIISTNAGSGKLALSWTPGTASDGSIVVVRAGAPVNAVKPSDGQVYTGDANVGSGSTLPLAGTFVVFSGSGSSVTVSNLSTGTNYFIAVYSYVGSGSSINYAGTPATGNQTPPAVLVSITLQLPSNLQTNGVAQAVVLANFETGPPVNVSGAATYTSSATNVLTVSTLGLVTSVSSVIGANATISAVYQGRTNSQTITLIGPPAPVLEHRYSFTADANDSVGTAHGTLMNSANINNGEVVLPNPLPPGTIASSLGTGAYVDLPNNLVTNLTAVTFETWITDNGSGNWGRVFDFGTSTGGEGIDGGGVRYMFLAVPGSGVTQTRAAYAYANNAIETGHQLTWTTANGGRPQVGKKTHIVFTTDAQTRRGVLYVDGLQVAVSTTFTNSPRDIGPTFNNWLGRAQFADPYWSGSIDEFRIYSNAMTAFQVSVNAVVGPGNILTDPGALQSIILAARTNMNLGTPQSAGVFANYVNVSNVNVTGQSTAFSSDNTNVLTVTTPGGQIRTVGLGTANIQVSFNGQTDSKSITVVPLPPAVMTHRYSFATDITDSVGGANGTINGPGTVTGGKMVFDGATFVSLPAGMITNYEAITFEGWVDFGDLPGGQMNLFSFAEILPNGTAPNFVRLTVHSGGAAGATLLSINGAVINSGVPIGGAPLNVTVGTLFNGPQHVVGVIDPPSGVMALYLNGRVLNTNVAFVPLSSVNNLFSFLGQSTPTDPFLFLGAMDEFRIYSGALTLAQIRASFLNGPDNPQLNAGTFTSVNIDTAPIMIQGMRRLPAVTGTSATVTNMNLTRLPGVSLTSSATNVISITADGRVVAVSPGVATVTATVGAISTSTQVRVVPRQTALMHRYSFTNYLADSVSGEDGSAWGHANTNSTALILDGTRSTWMELPPFLIDGYQTITVEAWVSTTPNGNFTRLFDFGNYNVAGDGNAYIFLSPNANANNLVRIQIDEGPGGNQNASTVAPSSLDGTGMHHLVAIFQTDPSQQRYMSLFLDGSQTLSNSAVTRNIATFTDDWNFIGRSLFTADSYMAATLEELRIYHGALTPAQITANFASGADGIPSVNVLPPALDVVRVGNSTVISWPEFPGGFTLKTSSNITTPAASWTTVPSGNPSGGRYTVTVPSTGMQFFRLSR